jgi:GNAT superfamily N-acetyltransferase
MSKDFTLRMLAPDEWVDTLPLIQLLNPKLAPEVLIDRMMQMGPLGYHCVGVFDGERLAGCCGFWVLVKYYVGKHIEPDNVIIHPDYRSHGLGAQMISFLEQYAREIDCDALELNVYMVNAAGQKFWMNQGYRTIGFHMQKQLKKA